MLFILHRLLAAKLRVYASTCRQWGLALIGGERRVRGGGVEALPKWIITCQCTEVNMHRWLLLKKQASETEEVDRITWSEPIVLLCRSSTSQDPPLWGGGRRRETPVGFY